MKNAKPHKPKLHKPKAKPTPNAHLDEPEPFAGLEDDVVHWGPDAIWAVDFTESGAPLGLTGREMRAAKRHGNSAPWAQAVDALDTLLRRQFPESSFEIGRMTFLQAGLSRAGYTATVDAVPPVPGLPDCCVVLLPRPEADPDFPDRAVRELCLLVRLQRLLLPFRIAQPLGLLPGPHGPIAVQGAVYGVPLDLRAGRQGSVAPWQVVGNLAAAVHGLAIAGIATRLDWLGGHPTRRAHALAALAPMAQVAQFGGPVAADALAWAQAHLPPDSPAVLLHGDLLGHNIMLGLNGDPDGVIDWEYATLGDPAADLAVVTRGARRPFQLAGGMERLLDAYQAAGGATVTVDEVAVHELALPARQWLWARQTVQDGGEPPDQVGLRFVGQARRTMAR